MMPSFHAAPVRALAGRYGLKMLLAFLMGALFAGALAADPDGSAAMIRGAAQLPRTEFVEIEYEFTAADAGPWEVALYFAADANGAWTRATQIFGDVGLNVSAGLRTMQWAAGPELPGDFLGELFLQVAAGRPINDVAVQQRDPLSGTKVSVDTRRFPGAPHHYGYAGSELHDLALDEHGRLNLSFHGVPPYRYGLEASFDLGAWTAVAFHRDGIGDVADLSPAAPELVRVGVPVVEHRFFRLVISRQPTQATWPPEIFHSTPVTPPMNPTDIQPGPTLRAAGGHTFVLAGAPTATWTADRLVRDELAKTGGFTRTTNVFAAQNGASASFPLTYVTGRETRYEIFATLPDGTVRTTTVQVFPAGVRASFMFESGVSGKRVPVYVVVPPTLDPARTKALSIHHGLSRNGNDYCDYWRDWAAANDTIAFAPTFDAEDWPGSSSYNLGNLLSGSSLRAESQWTFTIVERIIEHVLAGFALASPVADIWGHSAGGQFVHRMALFRPSAPVRFWMAANPGYWTLADLALAWPHGTAHAALGVTPDHVTQWSNRRMVVFRGTSDAHRDASLDTAAASDLQGPFRYVRAGTALSRMRLHNPATNWRLLEAPFVGHSGAVMARQAQDFLAAHPWAGSGLPRTLTVETVGQGMIHYPREQSFRAGSAVTLHAVPAEGFEFAGWTGALTGTANPAVLAVSGDHALTASFVPTTRRLIYWTGFDRGTALPANWSADAGWSLSTDNPSSGYAGPTHLSGASAYRNMVIDRSGSGTHNLTLSPVNTVGYTSLRVSWGARRSPSFTGKVTFQWSTNGTSWNTVSSWTDVPNDSVWRRVADFPLPEGAAGNSELHLRWRWTQSGSTSGTYRFDDPVITGLIATPAATLLDESFGTGPALPPGWNTSGSGWSVDEAFASHGYAGASGGGNLRARNNAPGGATAATRGGINTTGHRNITVSWAARRSAGFYNPIHCQWSIDGSTWHDLAYREVAAEVPWARINARVDIELPVAAWNVPQLRLRWHFTPTGNDGTYRLDDLRIRGVPAPGSAGE